MLAYCGIACGECPAYIATRNDDNVLRAETAEKWSREFKAGIKPEDINCDGCMSDSGRLFSHCNECKIRACARAKDLPNCAQCSEFICGDLKPILDYVPPAKAALEEIRKNR